MVRRINWVWRLFATGFSFLIFGLGGLLLGVVVLPTVLILSGSEEKKRTRVRKIINLSFRFFFWMMDRLGLLTYRIVGREKVTGDQGCLVIANHPSLIDVISLISLYPRASCIVKKELWTNFFLKRVVAAAGYIPNGDPEQILRDCAESLNRGDVIIIFPEGTRTVPGSEVVFHRGAAHIALRENCRIRVIQIDVNPSALTKNRPWYSIPDKKVDFSVTIKEMLDVSNFNQPGVPMSLASRRLTKKMRDSIDKSLPDLT